MRRRRRHGGMTGGAGGGSSSLDISLIFLSGYLEAIADPSATIEQLLLNWTTPDA